MQTQDTKFHPDRTIQEEHHKDRHNAKRHNLLAIHKRNYGHNRSCTENTHGAVFRSTKKTAECLLLPNTVIRLSM